VRAVEVCHRAAGLVGGDRARQHGEAVASHTKIAALWSAYLNTRITAHDVALMMALLKIARTKVGVFNLDDYVDAAGYAAIAAEVVGCDA
jgi:Domain of unknown function (DUF6378)